MLQYLRDRDNEYADAIKGAGQSMFGGKDDFLNSAMYAGTQMHGKRNDTDFYDFKEGEKNEALERFGKGANIATRYAVPAAGVTAAGIGLMDLTSAFGGSADQPEQNQLGLNNGEMSALGVVLASPLIAGGAYAASTLFEGEPASPMDVVNQMGQSGADQVAASYEIANEAARQGAKEKDLSILKETARRKRGGEARRRGRR